MRSGEAGPAISLKACFYDLPGAWQFIAVLCCFVSCCVLQSHLSRPTLNVFCAVHFNALLSWSGGFVATNELSLGKMLRFVMTGMSVVVTLILIVMALYVHALRIRASY